MEPKFGKTSLLSLRYTLTLSELKRGQYKQGRDSPDNVMEYRYVWCTP